MTEMTVGTALVLSAICFPVAVLIIGGLVGWLHRLTLDNRALRDTVRGLNRRLDDVSAIRRVDVDTWIVLREAGVLFRRYEQNHRDKITAPALSPRIDWSEADRAALDKAERNRIMAEKIEKELARNTPKTLRPANSFTAICEQLANAGGAV